MLASRARDQYEAYPQGNAHDHPDDGPEDRIPKNCAFSPCLFQPRALSATSGVGTTCGRTALEGGSPPVSDSMAEAVAFIALLNDPAKFFDERNQSFVTRDLRPYRVAPRYRTIQT